MPIRSMPSERYKMIEIALPTTPLSFDLAWLHCLTLNHNNHKDWRMPRLFEKCDDSNLFISTWLSEMEPAARHRTPMPDRIVIPVRETT